MVGMRPENDIELSKYASDVVRHANKINLLMREGQLYKACAVFSLIEHTAADAQRRINQIVDLAG